VSVFNQQPDVKAHVIASLRPDSNPCYQHRERW